MLTAIIVVLAVIGLVLQALTLVALRRAHLGLARQSLKRRRESNMLHNDVVRRLRAVEACVEHTRSDVNRNAS